MAKRKKPSKPVETEAAYINMNVPLPKPVFTFCAQVASLAATSVNTVICVMLATEVLKRHADSARGESDG